MATNSTATLPTSPIPKVALEFASDSYSLIADGLDELLGYSRGTLARVKSTAGEVPDAELAEAMEDELVFIVSELESLAKNHRESADDFALLARETRRGPKAKPINHRLALHVGRKPSSAKPGRKLKVEISTDELLAIVDTGKRAGTSIKDTCVAIATDHLKKHARRITGNRPALVKNLQRRYSEGRSAKIRKYETK